MNSLNFLIWIFINSTLICNYNIYDDFKDEVLKTNNILNKTKKLFSLMCFFHL